MKDVRAKQLLATAIYKGEVDGLATSEIAALYGLPKATCLRFLKRVISGEVLDSTFYPFVLVQDYEGVQICDDRVFVKSDCGDFSEGKTGSVNHYRWFLT